MITFENVSKTFISGNKKIHAVRNVNLHISKGKIFGIIGYSGAGKSTLVRCINLLERPTEGKVFLGDVDLTSLNKKELRIQRKRIGMIFQQFNLLSQKTVYKNISYPLEISGMSKNDIHTKVYKLLSLVGLEDKVNAYPAQLSGGQKQRVAIARALATDPEVLLCDEATSALDPKTTGSILDLLKDINEKLNVTIVVITHEMRVVQKICDEVAIIDDGAVVETGKVEDVFVNPKSQLARKLIIPEGADLCNVDKGIKLRIVFDGQSSSEPVISNLVLRCQTALNILGANTENINGKAFGQMLVQLVPESNSISAVKSYLDSVNVKYEEVSENDV